MMLAYFEIGCERIQLQYERGLVQEFMGLQVRITLTDITLHL